MNKIGNTLSFIVIFLGALWAQAQVMGNEGFLLQLTVISIIINAAIALYMELQTEITREMIEVMRTSKILTPALFTTHLFMANGILEDYLNYIPLVLTVSVTFTQFLVSDEVQRSRYLKFVMLAHCVAQVYCGLQTSNNVTLEAIILYCAYMIHESADLTSEISPCAQYNYLTGVFCMLLATSPL